jgi:hypothetical protein
MKSKKPANMLAIATGVLLLSFAGNAVGFNAIQVDPGPPRPVATEAKPLHDTLLEPSDLQSILPAAVFFKGQSAPLQMRNATGIHFVDGAYLFASLVDTSGYSSGVQEKYQAYFVTEIPLRFGEHKLDAGAYGVGFVAENKFLVMDIGGHDLFTISSARDEGLRHPTPLKIVQAQEAGSYRLYAGRMYVSFKRSE